MVEVGLTVLEVVVVRAASVYQVVVPELQMADNIELFPEQIIDGLAAMVVGAFGVMFVSDTEIFVLRVHPLASVAVIEYVPTVKLLNVPAGLCVPVFGEILYEIAPVPPVVEITIFPLFPPLQVILVMVGVPKVMAEGWLIVIVVNLVQISSLT